MKTGLIKTPEEIALIKEGGIKLGQILRTVAAAAKPGVTTGELDAMAEKMILESGGVPAFKHYRDRDDEPPFPSTICASVNDQLVHTPAGEYELQAGDILSIDIGMQYPAKDGLFTDMATTVAIGTISAEAKKLLKVTRRALEIGIKEARAGNYVSDIGKAVQKYVEGEGFSVVRELVGHGVGYAVHEDPRVPNYYDSRFPEVKLEEGMVIAIEPMVNVGNRAIDTLDDGWTIVTADGSLCAHFEHTVAIGKTKADILTPF